jgi:DNA-binding GntR family transcriptional regulator
MTVRRALAVLCEEGLIVKRRGTPAIVRPQMKQRALSLQRGQSLVVRMPSRQERIELDLDQGVPVLEVRRADESRELFAADEFEVKPATHVH